MKLKNVLTILAMLMIVFLAGCNKDETPGVPPTVTATNPSDDDTGVPLNQEVTITFSEPMDQATITGLTFTLEQSSIAVPGTVTYSGSIATFTPTDDLEPNLVYTATITTGAENLAGDGLVSNQSFSFTTTDLQDLILPTVISAVPLDGAVVVSRSSVVSLTFSEVMNPLTLTTSTFTLMHGETAVAGTVSYAGTTATFTPTDVLAAGMEYTATVTIEAQDLAGNALDAEEVWSFTTGGTLLGLAIVELGTAGDYVILAKTGITTTGTTLITGDIGISPAQASSITGFDLDYTTGTAFSTSALIDGNVYAPGYADPTPANLISAVSAMELAYTDAAGRTLPDYTELYTGNLGGKTLTPGLYKWTNTVTVPTSMTISGSPTDVWIFQIAGDLTVASAINVTLEGGALAENIFWQVSGIVTFGTTSHFEGIVLCMTAITYQTGASMNGRALAQTAVVLDANAITQPE